MFQQSISQRVDSASTRPSHPAPRNPRVIFTILIVVGVILVGISLLLLLHGRSTGAMGGTTVWM